MMGWRGGAVVVLGSWPAGASFDPPPPVDRAVAVCRSSRHATTPGQDRVEVISVTPRPSARSPSALARSAAARVLLARLFEVKSSVQVTRLRAGEGKTRRPRGFDRRRGSAATAATRRLIRAPPPRSSIVHSGDALRTAPSTGVSGTGAGPFPVQVAYTRQPFPLHACARCFFTTP